MMYVRCKTCKAVAKNERYLKHREGCLGMDLPELVTDDRRRECGRCGAPAVTGVRDIRDVTEPGDTWERWMPAGLPRWGCEAHPPEPSREIRG
jgi:hypothetical protein